MNSRKLTVLTSIAGVLALGEFGSALMIWLEHTGPAASAPGSLGTGCLVRVSQTRLGLLASPTEIP
jgi:hypothetical protein